MGVSMVVLHHPQINSLASVSTMELSALLAFRYHLLRVGNSVRYSSRERRSPHDKMSHGHGFMSFKEKEEEEYRHIERVLPVWAALWGAFFHLYGTWGQILWCGAGGQAKLCGSNCDSGMDGGVGFIWLVLDSLLAYFLFVVT